MISAIPNARAIGLTFETTNGSGFTIPEGTVLVYDVTVCKHTYPLSEVPNTVGDKYRYTITDCNNSDISGWIGDVIWCYLEYYNNTDGTWTHKAGGVKQWRWGYNDTDPKSGYYYPTHYVDFFWAIVPHNISAANYTLVNRAVAYSTMLYGDPGQISSSTPPPYGDIDNGVFCIWNGSATGSSPNSWLWTYQYNDKGILTQMNIYKSVSGVWDLDYQWQLESAPTNTAVLLLLLLYKPAIDYTVPIIIGVIIAIGITISIVLYKKRESIFLIRLKP
jgi:hypothetical protein